MNILHLTSSRFFGGPERQMLGLAEALGSDVKTVFASFSEGGLNRSFLEKVTEAGFVGIGLKHDTPRLLAARNEVASLIKSNKIDVLICHGYKGGIVGWFAAKKSNIPVVAVSRGWTAENWNVRLYERLDRMMLKRMDRVVCVSQAQAEKVRAAGVKQDRIEVIRNSIVMERFDTRDPGYRQRLLELFSESAQTKIKFIVGAAGRLSPEKGFDIFIDSAKHVLTERSDVGFVLFGDGPLHDLLFEQIITCGLQDHCKLAGFSGDFDRFVPHFDIFVQSSHTEGLPNVLLESLAAGTPVVATDVGGTREVLDDGRLGVLTTSGNVGELATAIKNGLSDPARKSLIAQDGRVWIGEHFSFEHQATAYSNVFRYLMANSV